MPGHRKFSDEKILYFLYRIFLCFVQYIYPWNRPFCYRMRFKVSPRQLPICLFSKPTGKKPNCKCQYTNDHPSKAIRHPNKHDSRFDSFDAGIFWPFESHHFLGFPAYLLNLVQASRLVEYAVLFQNDNAELAVPCLDDISSLQILLCKFFCHLLYLLSCGIRFLCSVLIVEERRAVRLLPAVAFFRPAMIISPYIRVRGCV